MQRRIALYLCSTRTSGELEQDLGQRVEALGCTVVATFSDQDAAGRRRNTWTGWKALLAGLDDVDQIAVVSAGDLPGRTVKDLLTVLCHLRDHGVGLLLLAEGIDTGNGSAFAILDIIQAFQRAKLSRAIRDGQAKARAAGKAIGRPEVSTTVRRRIAAALATDGGIRSTARKYGVSAATVSAIKKSMALDSDRLAA